MQFSSCRISRLVPAGLLMVTLVATGCRSSNWTMPTFSSWKMPRSSLFAKREPNAELLAGRNAVPQLPESPASKYTAESLTASKTPGSTSPAASAAGTGLAATANGFNASFPATTPSSTTGQQPTQSPYQTGPYQMAGANTGGYGPTNFGTAGSSSLPSPYGGGLGSSPMTGNVVATAPSISYPPLPNSTAPTTFGSSPVTPPVLPTSFGSEASLAGGPALPAVGWPAASPPQGTESFNSNMSATPTAPRNSAYQATGTPGTFAPGSTGRTSAYDFSVGGAPATPSSTAVQSPTTTQTTRPTFTLPPNTATNPGGSLLR
jgi:hypothetical protein